MKKRLFVLSGFFVSPLLFSQILRVNFEPSVSISSSSSVALDAKEMF